MYREALICIYFAFVPTMTPPDERSGESLAVSDDRLDRIPGSEANWELGYALGISWNISL